MDATAITDVDDVPADGTFLFTVTEPSGREEEVILARVDDGEESASDGPAGSGRSTGDGATGGDESAETADESVSGAGTVETAVAAWKNFCMHEPDQRLDRGGDVGAATRDGEVICPRHGSMFDLQTGGCDNGPARNQALIAVDVTVRDGTVYLIDDGLTFEHEGGVDDDDTPSSTTHMSF